MKLLLPLLFVCFISMTYAQKTYTIERYDECPADFQYLLLPNYKIAENDTINEKVVDLVSPMLLDSTIDRKKQHHKLGPLGWMIHAFGNFNWRAMYMTKEKVVGTVIRISRSGKERYTEYDINFDLNFHLDKYLYRVFKSYDRQAKIKRQDITSKHKRDYKSPPFVRDTNNIDRKKYRLHCELTPERAFRPALNYLFYPTLPSAGGLAKHPNFETDEPTVGFYGVMCLDCNHSCHPEIHPYEWMWWLKATEKDSSMVKEWHLGIFHEASNRLKNWSKNPMIGKTRIPFAFKTGSQPKIVIKHGVMGEFLEEDGLSQLEIEANHFQSNQSKSKILLKGKNITQSIGLEVINPIRTEGLKYWISDLNYDAKNQIISGFLHYAVAVQDLYTTRIQFHP
jgi:hypothetical protein